MLSWSVRPTFLNNTLSHEVLQGNHDTWPQAFDAPHSIQPETLANQFQWNYDHISE